MTETAVEGLGNAFPELGAKSPEKEKPKSAPRGSTRKTGGGGGRDNNKPRERAEPVDDGEPLIPPPTVKEPSQDEQDAIDAKFRAEIEKENERVVSGKADFGSRAHFCLHHFALPAAHPPVTAICSMICRGSVVCHEARGWAGA